MIAQDGRAPLRFATFLAPNMLPVYRFLADRISDRLGRPVELVVGTSFDQFEHGEADLGVICGLPYVWLANRRPAPITPQAAPILTGDRYQGRPIYYSDVIAHLDSPITRIQELRGCCWAYNEPASHSGHTVTLYSLVRMGFRPGFFARVVQAGFHQRAIRLVHEGTVDAAAIDSQVLAIELRDHPQLADSLRVVDTFGPSTIQPVVAASRLPDRLKDEVRELLVELGADPTARPTLDHGFIERFTAVDDAAYDDTRAMLATIHAAGWTSLAQPALTPDRTQALARQHSVDEGQATPAMIAAFSPTTELLAPNSTHQQHSVVAANATPPASHPSTWQQFSSCTRGRPGVVLTNAQLRLYDSS
jgi:phosphonate transport system substrate-binding protein